MPPEDEEKTEVRNAPEDSYPCLEVLASPRGPGGRHLLRQGKNFIGRASDNDVVLDDSSVSRSHAQIEVTPEAVTLTDLGSRNGTRVGGRKIAEPTPLPHNTQFKIGLFQMRFLSEPAPAVSPEPMGDEEAPATQEKKEVSEELAAPEGEEGAAEGEFPEEEGEVAGEEALAEAAGGRRRRWLPLLGITAVLAVVGLGAAIFIPKVIRLVSKGPNVERRAADRPGEVGGVTRAEKVKVARPEPAKKPVFLDFSSTPIPAEVYFGAERVGVTPLRNSVTLEEGKFYEARGLFQLADVGEVVEEKVKFRFQPGASILPVQFTGKIALVKISSLARDAQLYLEGYFEADPTRAKPLKFSEIVFGKPYYVPFGRYVLELRKSKQLGISQTFVDEVVYRREFILGPNQTNYTVAVTDEDLKKFPVEITSAPPGAKVFIDGTEVGPAPYAGTFPVGEHLLTLKKEGYFDFSQVIKMDLNAPFVAEIELKTSAAGEMINQGAAFMREERYSEALPILVEALNKNPSPREVAQISYLIGLCFLRNQHWDDARNYFMKAMEHEDYRLAARLGIAELTHGEGDPVKALQLLVEVLAAAQDPEVRAEAGRFFQKLSPLKSVLYVTSQPDGATVLVNAQAMEQKTPLILHELGVGAYRIEIRKEGFEPSEVKLNLGVSEFRPVVVQLKPIE